MASPKTPVSNHDHQSSLGLLPWLIGIALSACLLSLALFNSIQVQSETQRVKAEVRYTLDHYANTLEKIVGKASASLHAIEVFVRQTPRLEQSSFEQFSTLLSVDNPAIRSLQYAPDGILTFLTNPALNQSAIGMNLYKAPLTAPFLEEAALTGKTIMEGPRELVQGGHALILRYPVFRQRNPDNNRDLMGFAAVLIDFEHLKQKVIEPLEQQGLLVSVQQKSPMNANWQKVHGDPATTLSDPISSTVFFPYGEWTIEVAPKQGWSKPIGLHPYLVLLAVITMTMVVWMSLYEYRSRRAMKAAYESAKSANELKDKLIANVSHEIRTPLTSINSIAIMLDAPGYPVEIQELGRAIKQSSESVHTIVNDLLDLSKIRQGYFRLNNNDFRIDDLIDNTANMLQQQWLQKPGVEPVLLELPASRATYHGDRGRIEQVIQNLISNAFKFTHFGRVTVQIRVVAESREQDQLIVVVSDTGVGIPGHDIERIFDAFYQVDSSLQKRYNGAGLGLAICRQIIEVMGGTIHVRSEPNIGTQFEFRLPLPHGNLSQGRAKPVVNPGSRILLQIGETPMESRLAQTLEPDWQVQFIHHSSTQEKILPVHNNARILLDMPGPFTASKAEWLSQFLDRQANLGQDMVWLGTELPAIAEQRQIRLLMKPLTRSRLDRAYKPAGKQESPVEQDQPQQAPLRLLLAEDNTLNAKVFKKLLENRGVAVSCVNNGADALALLTSGNAHFDAVLMDLQMPVMDGLEATRLIRKREELQGLLVYAVSGHVSNSMRNECLNIGFTNFITKPFDPDLLIEDIQARLQEHSRTY
jgi:signal transduction histidine kinase/ActR/RegA family two-component response regulator